MSSPTGPRSLQKIVLKLFSKQPNCNLPIAHDKEEQILPVTHDKLKRACDKTENQKSLGENPNNALQETINENSDIFIHMYCWCLQEGAVAEAGNSRLNKQMDELSSYCPLCIIDQTRKVPK